MSADYDAIIIGAGAAGLYCALHAGRRGRRVLVLEHNAEPGAKILISGGGRCNFTNVEATAQYATQRFLSANPHFARSALARHTPMDFIALLERHGIAYYEKTLGQLFGEGARAARGIVAMLLDECAAAQVCVRCNATIHELRRGDQFDLTTSAGDFTAERVVIASGGLSIAKLGATAFAYDIAAKFNVPIVPPRPGLAPLTFGDADLAWMRPLSGVSTPARISCAGAVFEEAVLFTHRGLSGPAVLQASSYWREGEALSVDWLPNTTEDELTERKRERPKAHIRTALAQRLPERLAAALAETLPQGPLGDIKDQTLKDAARTLKHWRLTPSGTEGYAKAEVTVGGVSTEALSQQTMEVRAVPGLFFIGEAVDVTGWLGGYNFQWAWSSAWACAQAL